jgi:hypothetical protein
MLGQAKPQVRRAGQQRLDLRRGAAAGAAGVIEKLHQQRTFAAGFDQSGQPSRRQGRGMAKLRRGDPSIAAMSNKRCPRAEAAKAQQAAAKIIRRDG